MKVAFLTYNRDPAIPQIDNDGCPVTARNYAIQLAKRGHSIDIYANRIIPTKESNSYIKRKYDLQQDDVVFLDENIRVIRLSLERPSKINVQPNSELSDFTEILESINAGNYFSDKKLYQYDVICVFHPMTLVGLVFTNFVPLHKTVLFPMLLSDEYKKYQFVSNIYTELETHILMNVGAIFSSSDYEKEVIMKKGISESKVIVIPRGFNNASFKYNPHNSIDTQKISVVTVGSIRPQKRQDQLVEIALRLKKKGYNIEFNIIGDNKNFVKEEYIHYYENILSRIKENDLVFNIKFIGSHTPEEISNIFKDSHIALLPSIAESFGKAALESICSGIPTILCKNVSAYDGFAKDRINALLVDDNPDEYAKAIEELILNKDLYSVLSRNGQKSNKEYSWEKVSEDLEKELLSFVKTL